MSKIIFDIRQTNIPKLKSKLLGCFDNFSRFDTTSANFLTTVRAVRQLDADRLQVRFKAAASAIVSVRNIISELRSFAANITAFCHY